jgi:malate dehydrogenase
MAMVEAVLLDEKRLMPCAVNLNGEYGIKDTFCGTMIKIGAGGAEQVYEVEVSAEEKAKIVAAAKSTAELAAII